MSHLAYHDYKGCGEFARDNLGYSQAVRRGNKIEISGQGGWDHTFYGVRGLDDDAEKQIAQAFENVEVALKAAGGTGWDQVYKVRSYHVPIDEKALGAMGAGFKKYCPNHKPIWTAIGVPALGMPEMKVEIEVKAEIPQ